MHKANWEGLHHFFPLLFLIFLLHRILRQIYDSKRSAQATVLLIFERKCLVYHLLTCSEIAPIRQI